MRHRVSLLVVPGRLDRLFKLHGGGYHRHAVQCKTYLLRSFLRCGACGLRTHRRERHGVAYYACETARRQATLVAPEHPKMVYVREDRAAEQVIEFLQTHLFGPGRREGLARALDESHPEREARRDEVERIRSELAEVALRIRRQLSHLEALEADADAAAEIRSRLRELAALKARRERELGAAEAALAATPDLEQAQELVDLLPSLNVDAALLAEESFRELLGALDFRATFEPARNELRVRAMLAAELLPANGRGTSSLSSVHPTGQYSKKCPQVEGHVLRLSARHAKLRREGYRKLEHR